VNDLLECSSTIIVKPPELQLTIASSAECLSDPPHLLENGRSAWPHAMQLQQSWGTTSVEFTADSDTQFRLAKELIIRLSFLTLRVKHQPN
jgi:hypothetical protein